jgi:hypothetical protein
MLVPRKQRKSQPAKVLCRARDPRIRGRTRRIETLAKAGREEAGLGGVEVEEAGRRIETLKTKVREAKTLAGKTLAGKTLAGKTLAGKTLAGKTLAGKTLAEKTLAEKTPVCPRVTVIHPDRTLARTAKVKTVPGVAGLDAGVAGDPQRIPVVRDVASR